MEANFQRSLKAVLAHEGGYVDHPKDPGGATNLGVTIGTAKALGIDIDGDGDTDKVDIRLLKPADAAKVYKHQYWDRVSGNNLPAGVDYAVFDFAVNSGVSRAAIYLQEIVGVAPDGKIGPLTIQAVAAWDAVKLIEKLSANRMAFLKRLSTWPTFGKGWSSRVTGVLRLAKDMALAFPAPKPATTPTSAKPQRKTLMDWLKGLLVKQAVNHVAHQLKDTPIMNSNFLHNLLNIAIALVAILSLPEVTAVLPPEFGVVVAGVLAALKTVINIARDGFGGLFKEQPPVR